MLPSKMLFLSTAVIVKFEAPAVVGVPLNTPVLPFSVNPDGSRPALTTNLYAPEPPLALKSTLKGLLAVALGSVAGLTVK